uniref:ArsI/CadI family heavy metal resistance metalloenzyme n=1 Tax=Roseihalotalea indica TaxID=2867963 RepID=A0AA49GK12_9BACT|nr:ArsI/CadI family heavy metal resistance metalloenzyme [Tunicatimonas sp. TK19036]
MKRLHVNVQVKELTSSVEFYQQLFDAEPTVQKSDYAKWMLDDPLVNFSISLSNEQEGIEHLGIQVDSEGEREELFRRLDHIEGKRFDEGDTVCCYAHSTKSWISDPQGVSWEIFQTHGASETNKAAANACCDDTCCTTEEVK